MINTRIIEWPDVNFNQLWDFEVENRGARIMYKAVLVALILPQILIKSFYDVLRFKG